MEPLNFEWTGFANGCGAVLERVLSLKGDERPGILFHHKIEMEERKGMEERKLHIWLY